MAYRTRTYIAGDWTGDRNLIEALQFWNKSSWWGLSYIDAHELTQARDTSLPCSIRKSLKERLDASKTFVLIVGDHTKDLTKGGCRHCQSYSVYGTCHRGHSVSHRSFIEYECEYAVEHDLKIVVLYNGYLAARDKCPEVLRYRGIHLLAIRYTAELKPEWDIPAISKAICG